MNVSVLVIAKAPRPGRTKTRLCPPCTPEQAAGLAAAALDDTIEAVTRTDVPGRRVLVFDGDRAPALPSGWTVIAQRGEGLDRRLANAFVDVDGPGLLVGMDTPQLTPGLLAGAVEALGAPGVDVVLGPAEDGGYWAIGFRVPRPEALVGVPMSSDATLSAQRRLLDGLGLGVVELPPLRDVDSFEDADVVARQAPGTRFAAALGAVRRSLVAGNVS